MSEIDEIPPSDRARVLAGLEGESYQHLLGSSLELLELVAKVTSPASPTNSRKIASSFLEFHGRRISSVMIERELRILEKAGILVMLQEEGNNFSIRFNALGDEVLALRKENQPR